MREKDVARAGFGVLAFANVVFFFAGFDRGPIYLALQLVSVGLALSAMRLENSAVATTFGGLAAVRIVTVALDLSRLPIWLNLALAVVGIAGAVSIARRNYRRARTAAWALSIGYFVAMALSVSGGRFATMLGLLSATIAWALVAPNLALSPLGQVRQEVVAAQDP